MADWEIAEFVIYIINEIANLTGKTTSKVYQVLSETDCIRNYLAPCYDVLHTMSSQSIVEDVLNYVRLRGEAI